MDWKRKKIILVTVHRRENWGGNLEDINFAIKHLVAERNDISFLIPMHKNNIVRDKIISDLSGTSGIFLTNPLNYEDEWRKIKINGLESNDLNLKKKIELLKLNNLFLIDKFQLQKLFETINFIDEYKIFKKYPSSLEIEITETKFLALTNINGKNFFVGSNGKLIESKNIENNLPYIFGNFDINNFLNLKKIIDESNLNYEEIKNLYFFPSGRWDIETFSEVLIKLPNERLKESLDLSLKLLIDKKFDNIKLIDVRQKNQVIINE